MSVDYSALLDRKRFVVDSQGVDVPADRLHPALFPFQRDLVRWSLRKGRAALFADTGMGKTLMQLAWAQEAATRVLVLAPLAVARQTVAEGARFGIPVAYARSQAGAAEHGITITNYEMVEHFDPAAFGAVVLDESSCLKDYASQTRNQLIDLFSVTPMRLCCTATPAPNDVAELANHAEFLGVMSRVQMLATFFVHDDDGWRLRKHARDAFYRWLASWGMSLRKPSDLGYADDGYDLPPLSIESVIVPTGYVPEGQLFATALKGVGQRAEVRRGTLAERVEAAISLIEGSWANQTLSTGAGTTPSTENNDSRTSDDPTNGMPRPEGSRSAPAERVPTKNSSAPTSGPTTKPTSTVIGSEAPPFSSADTGLTSRVSSPCSNHKAACAPSVGGSRSPGVDAISTMTTQAVPSGASCATDAISCSAGSTTQPSAFGSTVTPKPLSTSREPWIVWVGLNSEQDEIVRRLGDQCISVDGALSPDEKANRLEAFARGDYPVLVTKCSIAAHGLNFQHCARMAFVGLSDSFESYYQAIRRCWRYGQMRPVVAHIVLTDLEEPIYGNVLRKEREASVMASALVRHVASFERAEIGRLDDQQGDYRPTQPMRLPEWMEAA